MSWYEWVLGIPWYVWLIGFGIKSYFSVNVWITHRRIAARRANLPYVRPDLLTFVIGYAVALPLVGGNKLIRYWRCSREQLSTARPQVRS